MRGQTRATLGSALLLSQVTGRTPGSGSPLHTRAAGSPSQSVNTLRQCPADLVLLGSSGKQALHCSDDGGAAGGKEGFAFVRVRGQQVALASPGRGELVDEDQDVDGLPPGVEVARPLRVAQGMSKLLWQRTKDSGGLRLASLRSEVVGRCPLVGLGFRRVLVQQRFVGRFVEASV